MINPRIRLVTSNPALGCTPVSCKDCGVYQLCLPMGLNQSDTSLLDGVVKRKQVYKRGEVLYRVGQPFEYIYAIRSGSVKTYVLTDDGRVQITGFHLAGELIGLSDIDSRVYSCEARALETTSVCEVSIERFQELVERMPSIQYQMLKIMSGEIRHNQELMLLLGKKSAEERMATYLFSLSQRFERRNYSPAQFNLSMSRSDIGNYLGLAEETVCRVLARFQDEGLITTQRRQINLNNMEKLRNIARG
jgi:CRP/FNR family transcriptional regulator, anaerobic regulatory protein